MTNAEAIALFPKGTRVRLSLPDGRDTSESHGVGVVTGPLPDTEHYRKWGKDAGGCVYVRWPDAKLIPGAVTPASVRYLVQVAPPMPEDAEVPDLGDSFSAPSTWVQGGGQ